MLHLMAWVDPEAYGLHPDGSPETNSLALQDAVAAGPVLLPPKTYKVARTQLPQNAVIVGCGQMRSRLLSTSPTAALHIPVVAVGGTSYPLPGLAGLRLEDFAVEPIASGVGERAIWAEAIEPLSHMRDWSIRRLRIGAFSKHGIHLDNTIEDHDCFFLGIIEECVIDASGRTGIYAQKIGDSVTIRKNKIHGTGGVALKASFIPGGSLGVIAENSFTTLSAGLVAIGGTKTIVSRNWFETPAYLGNFNSQNGNADCLVALIGSESPVCEDNCIGGQHGVEKTVGPGYGVILGAGTHRARVNNNWGGQFRVAPYLDASGNGSNALPSGNYWV